jgi:hypothetical protein
VTDNDWESEWAGIVNEVWADEGLELRLGVDA